MLSEEAKRRIDNDILNKAGEKSPAVPSMLTEESKAKIDAKLGPLQSTLENPLPNGLKEKAYTDAEVPKSRYREGEDASYWDYRLDTLFLPFDLITGNLDKNSAAQGMRYALQKQLNKEGEEIFAPRNIIVPEEATEDEKRTYMLAANQDENLASQYSDYLNAKYSERNKVAEISETIDSWNAPQAVKNAAKLGRAIPSSMRAGVEGVVGAFQGAVYGNIDRDLFVGSDIADQLVGEVSEDIEKRTAGTIWDISGSALSQMTGVNNLASFLVQSGYSGAQSLALMSTMGPVGVAMMSGQAAASAMKEALDNGESADTALGYGIASGVFEALFEKVSLDQVIHGNNVESFKDLVKNFLKYSFVEGSEEFATEVADRLSELVIRGDEAQFAKDKAEYIATHSGATELDADLYAVKNLLGAAGAAFVGGAISGGPMGATTDIFNTAATNNAYKKIAQEYQNAGNLEALYGMLQENAEATQRDFTLDKNASMGQYGKEVSAALRGISTDAITQRLVETGLSEEDARRTANSIYRSVNNYNLSAKEKADLKSDEAQGVIEDLNREDFVPEWVQAMNMAQSAFVMSAKDDYSVPPATTPQREKITTEEADKRLRAERAANPYTPMEVSARMALNNVELEEVNADEVLSSYANANNISLDELKNDYSAFKAENPLYTAEAYLKTLDEAYQYGKIGGTLQQLGNRQELRDLTTALYTKGTQEYLKSMTNAAKQAEVRRKGYTFRNNGKSAFATERDIQVAGLNGARTITESDLSDRNAAEVQVLDEFNKGLGIAVKYFAADVAQGTQEGVFFTNIDGTPTIMLDINAPMLWKYAHEFTHWMKRDTPEIWNNLYQIIIDRFYSGKENDLLRDARNLKAQQDMADENFKRQNGILKNGEEYRSTLTPEDAVEEIVAKHCESIFDNADLLAEVAQKSPTLWDKIREFFDKLLNTIKEVIAGYGKNNKYAEQLAKDQQALEKVQSLILQAREVAEQMVETQEIVDEMPAETTEAVDPATVTHYSYRSLAQAYGFTAYEENGERFWATPMGKVSQITKADVLNSPIGAMIDYSKEQGYISDKEYKAQVDLFVEIGNMALKSRDFAMAMQFAGSNIFTGMKQNADKQYKTTYDFPSICTKTQAVIEAMSAAMMKKGGGLTDTEIAREYKRVWAFGNSVPCPECYVFSRWVKIGGLLDNIKKYQTRFLKMDPAEVEREYQKMYAEIDQVAKDNDLTFGKAKTKLAAKYTKMYTDLTDKIAKAEEAGDEISARDVEKLALVESQMDTVKAMTWIDTVYFADASHTKVNPNAEVPDNVLFDLNAGETFASKYKEAWAFRTTQGAGYGKAITPPAEAVLGEGILINNNASKAIKAKANGELKNIFLEQRGKMSPEATKILETARRKQLSQAFIGGQRFQSTSDARYDNFTDYLLAALEMQAMHGMVQVYTKVSGAVPVFNLWGFSINQSLMPKNNGLTEDGKLSDTSTGGMIPSVAFRNRLDYESAGTITIGVNDEHIRKLFADINRDFIIPYHASGGDKILISEFRRIQDSDLKTTSQSTDYSKVQGEKLMQDDLLKSLGYTDEQIADVAKFREQRLAIITGRGSIDLNYIKKAGNEVLARLYDQIKNGKWKGVTQPKGVVETQIFPNEYWDESVTYDNSGKIVEDYLEYCRRLGMLHKFSGKTIAYNRKTGQHELVSVHGYDRNGVKVALTDLAYIDGDASKGVEPFFWKVLVDRRMYDNEGNYLPQKFVSLAESDTGITQFARNNEGSAREYDPEKSRRTIEAINADERYSGKGGLIATPEASINDRAESLKGTVASRLSKFSTRTYFGTEATNNLIADKTYGPLVEALVNTIKAETTRFSPSEFIRVYTNNPELDFATRIQDGDGQAAFELADMLSKIDDVQIIDDLRWYALESHPLYKDLHTGNMFSDSKGHLATYAQTHRKGIKEFRRLCDERVAQIMSKDNVGASLNIKNLTDMPVKDVKALFDKLNHNAELQRLADRVFKIAEGLNIAAVFSSSINQRYGGVWVGNWSRLTGRNGIVCYNTATFNSPQYTDDQKATILLHEMIHAITVNGWHIHNNTIRNTNGVVSDASDIAFNGFKAIYDKLSRSAIGPDLRSSYGMSDIKEFMAEMANPEFRDQLAAVSVPDMNAYLDSLKFLVPVLGGNATGTTLDSLVTILDYYVDSFDPNIDGWGQNVFSRERHYKEYKTLPKYAVRTYEGKMKCQGGSFFSGGGLIDYALKDMVHHEFAVEYDARIAAYYELNNGIPAHGDVTDPKIMEKLRKLSGQIDYFHASPVCKRYSAANKQGGEQPIDVLTAKKTAQALRILKPKVFTLENVRGYQNSEALRLIKKALNDLGYTWDEGVYNSAQFGADTSRSRYFIRAVMNAELPPMPEYVETSRGWYEAVEDLIPELQESALPNWMRERLEKQNVDLKAPGGYIFVMGTGDKNGLVRYYHPDEVVGTFLASGGQPKIITPEGKVLEVTPRIVARLTGLDDSYKLPAEKTRAFQILGNGVPVKLTQAVVAPLLDKTLITPALEEVIRDRKAIADMALPKYSTRYAYTDNFNQWFAGSEVTNEDGTPRIVYHATDADFTVFDRAMLGKNTDGNASDNLLAASAHIGHWFNSSDLSNRLYMKKAMPVYLAIKSPLYLDDLDALTEWIEDNVSVDGSPATIGNQAAGELRRQGYDGIILNDTEFGGTSYVVLDSQQVKSATDNIGTFDESNPDIRYSTRYAYTAHITEERVDKYLESYAIEDSPNTSQAWIGYADNYDFVKATSDYTSFVWVSEGTEQLDPERLRKERQPIFLDVDLDSDGKPVAITGHEGRHRSLAMSREGISRGPVILFDYGHWEKNRNSYPSVYLRGQRNAMDNIFVRDVIPLDYAHRDEIIKTFSELSSNEKMLEKYGGQVLKYSTRTELSNYEILAELLDSRLENKADKDALRIYKNSYNEALKIRSEIDRLNNQLSYEPSQGAEGNIRARIRELQKSLREREKILDQVITKPRIAAVVASQKADVQKLEGYLMDEQMSHQEDIEALEKRLGKLAEKVEQRAQAFRNYRAKVSEQRGVNYYRPRIEKIAKSLASQLETTLPMPFRQPIAGVLSMLDFTTKKDGQMRGNKANMDRVAAQAAFAKLSQESVDPLKFYQDYGIALSPEFRDWILEIQQWFNDATSGMTVSDLRAMDSYQLACLYKFLKNIDTQAKRATKLYTAKATDVREVSQRTIGHLIPLEKKEGNRVFKAVDSFFGWRNATPVTVFDRFGTGGQDIWWGFMEAQDKLAIANDEIQAFADEHFKDTDKLRSELVEVEIGGEKISAPISYWMTLYEYLKQKDSYRHLIQGGGFRLEDYNHKGKTVTDKDRFMSEDDIVAVYNALTDEQKAMADEAAKFMREKGAAYGNYVTRTLYGYDGFGQIEDYFPIRTIRSMTEEAKVQEEAKGNLYGMMNKSWTKARVLNANNALVVGDIFDIFAKHLGEMATYYSFALPTLDTIKWLNYKEVSKSADKPREESVQKEMKLAFGDDASRYIFDFLDSLNGTAMDRDNSAVMRLVSAKNRVAVGANFRVMIQQPLSVTRAFSLIDPKWFKPYNYKSAHEEMLRYSGIAKWKEDGHYEINISRSLAERIAPNKSQKIGKKVSDVTMAGAEFGDKITWTAIWVACKNEVSSQNPGLSGEDLMTKTNERFRDIIYRTQVVDSTLTRSDWMRKKDYLHRITSSFKSEPTQTLNMLMRAVDSFRYDSRTMGASSAWAKNRATVTRTLVAFALTQIVNAAATAVIDAFRDDDDYETWYEKWLAAFKGGVGENMLLLGSVPYVGEIVSLLKGYSPSRPDLDTISNLISTSKQIYNSIKNASMSPKTVFNIVSVASTLTGIPMQNVMRDVVGLYNGTIGILYDLGITDSTSAKWQMSPETNKSGYEAFYSALKEGKSQRALSLLTEMADNDLDAKKVYTGTYNLVKADLLAGKITKAEAEAYVRQIVDMVGLERSDADIRKLVEGWLD